MPLINHKIEISQKSIIFTMMLLVGGYFIYQITDIILFIFIAILLMAALNPLVNRLEAWKLSRGLSIAVVYVLMVALISISIAAIIPPLISQVVTLVTQIPLPPDLATNFSSLNLTLQDYQVIANQLNSVPKVFSVIGSAFSGVLVFVSLLVMSFYLLVERARLPEILKSIYKTEKEAYKAYNFITKVESQIGSWVRAEFTLMIIVGLLTFLGLSVLKINFALSLAIVAGLLEILPNLGPTISAFPAILVAYFTASPVMALAVAILYILVQQIENNLIVPMVMRQVVGLSPVITIILLLVGYRLGGVTGTALGIPIFLVLKVVAVELYKLRDQLE